MVLKHIFVNYCRVFPNTYVTNVYCNTIRRCYSTKALKKFYKNVTIAQSEGSYEINLDKRKLKTPLGKLFKVPTESLALAVLTEWHGQKDVIKRHNMHMTSLCNTAIDNPTNRSREVVINGILEYLETDTICYRLNEPQDLAELQMQEWDPIMSWLKERYNVEIEPTTGFGIPEVPSETKDVFRQHLLSFNDWALVGYQQCVETLKSLILTMALVDRHIGVEKAVYLSRLEQEFQTEKWGNVEWYHDIDLMALRSRVASALLFTHLNMEETRTVFSKANASHPV